MTAVTAKNPEVNPWWIRTRYQNRCFLREIHHFFAKPYVWKYQIGDMKTDKPEFDRALRRHHLTEGGPSSCHGGTF